MSEPEPPGLESVDALFLAISPMTPSVEDWIKWRAGFLHVCPDEGIMLGEQTSAAELTSLDAREMPWPSAVETAFKRSRRFPGALVPAHESRSFLDASLAAPFAALGGSYSLSVWLLASAEIGPCLIVGCAFEKASPQQSDIGSAIYAAIGPTARSKLAAASGADAPKWLGAFKNLVVNDEQTHVIGIYRARRDAAAAGGVATFDPRWLDIHLSEEAVAADEAADYRYEHSTLAYAHVGFSYTTVAAEKFSDAIFLLPSSAMAQLSWALQRSFEQWLRFRSWEPKGPPSAKAAEHLSKFEQIKLELKLFKLGRLAFREGLRPWQQRFFQRYIDYWHIDDSGNVLEEASDQVSTFLDAGVQVRVSVANDRQSQILLVITALGVLGLSSTASAYDDLLTGVAFVDQVHRASGYAEGVVIFFASTIVLTAICIVLGIRRS
jgi:hypothetical protein